MIGLSVIRSLLLSLSEPNELVRKEVERQLQHPKFCKANVVEYFEDKINQKQSIKLILKDLIETKSELRMDSSRVLGNSFSFTVSNNANKVFFETETVRYLIELYNSLDSINFNSSTINKNSHIAPNSKYIDFTQYITK